MTLKKDQIPKPDGKLGVLIPGIGAVGTTMMAGTYLCRKGLKVPKGSLTQMAKIQVKKDESDTRHNLNIKDYVPLASLDDIVYGGWDIFEDDGYEAAVKAEVLTKSDLDLVKDELQSVKPMKAVFDKKYCRNLDGTWIKSGSNKMELAKKLIEDIENFKKENNCERVVVMWCASTEIYIENTPGIHDTLANFEKAMEENHELIAPSMIYAYASIKCGAPFMMGAPNLCIDIPAMHELADNEKVAIGGKDFKSGQTMMKTILAPGLKARMLGLDGWFSTNILGNRDGEVLDAPENFKTKEISKLSVLDAILEPELYPDLYKDYYHKVRINYYPPRKDNKEGWDNIDISGWLDYPMQIKIDFLCRDSILAAPIALDLVIFADLAQRAGLYGNQEWLSFYWKTPMNTDQPPCEDLFLQLMKMKNTLRWLMDDQLVTPLGGEHYE